MDTLKVYSVGSILVLDIDYAQQAGGRRKYVGRYEVPSWDIGALPPDAPRHIHYNEFLEPGQKAVPHVGYPALSAPAEVPNTSYYRKAIVKGDLRPADAATAAECGVEFYV